MLLMDVHLSLSTFALRCPSFVNDEPFKVDAMTPARCHGL